MQKRTLVATIGNDKPMNITLITGCWFLFPHTRAMTLGKALILTRSKTPITDSSLALAHELVHVIQFRQVKHFAFKYLQEFIRHGYGMKNAYERVAYECQESYHRITVMTLTP